MSKDIDSDDELLSKEDTVDAQDELQSTDDNAVSSEEFEHEGDSQDAIGGEDVDAMTDGDNLEKMILSTGIRVGTPVKTKFMVPFIVKANPEGLYILDISKTLFRIDVAAKFIGRTDISKVAVTSAREYGKTPVEKFCEITGATPILGRFMPGTFPTHHFQLIWNRKLWLSLTHRLTSRPFSKPLGLAFP